MLGDYSYIAHVESLIEVLKSGNNVFAMPIDRDMAIEQDTDLGYIVTVQDAIVSAFPDVILRFAEGCTITDDDRSGFAAAGARVASLGFSGREFAYVVEPGDIVFYVGSSSSDLVPAGTVVVRGDKPMPTVRSTTNHVIIDEHPRET